MTKTAKPRSLKSRVAPEKKVLFRITVNHQDKPGTKAVLKVINDPCRPNIAYGLRPLANSRGYAWSNKANAEAHLAEIQKVYPKAKITEVLKVDYDRDRHRGPAAKTVQMLPGEVFGSAQTTMEFGF